MRGGVSNEPLREAFLRSGRTYGHVCREIGWVSQRQPHGDTTRLARALGIRPESGRRVYRTHVRYETATIIARALDLDPVDVGC